MRLFVLLFAFTFAAASFMMTAPDAEAQDRANRSADQQQTAVTNGAGLMDNGDDEADGPIKPPMPELRAVPGDGTVLLYWDDVAESHYDPFFEDYVVYSRLVGGSIFEPVFANPNNFQGYKVYKSNDPGFLDALRITDNQGNPDRLAFEAIFDLANDITGYHPASINGQRVWMGSDTGIRRIWQDTGLTNGRTYYYAVVSYTHGDALPNFELPIEFDDEGIPVVPIPSEIYRSSPLESDLDIQIMEDGTVITGINVVAVTPQRGAAGFIAPVDPALTQVSGTGSGNVTVEVIDPARLRGGNNYSVTFADTLVEVVGDLRLSTKSFTLTNTTTGEVLFDRVEDLTGTEFPVTEGFLFSISDVPDRVAVDPELTQWRTDQDTRIHDFVVGVSSTPTPNDYRIEIYDDAVRTSTPFQVGSNNLPAEDVNFIVFNETTGQEVDFAFLTQPLLPRDIRDVAYLGSNSIIAVGAAGLIQQSTDGGVSWSIIESGQTVRLKAVHFINDQQGWAVGREGVIVTTSDGGLTWSDQESGTSEILRDVYFLNENLGWAVGSQGNIVRTTDGGSNWVTSTSGTLRRFNAVHFVNENVGFAAGFLETRRTTDGGQTWTTFNTGQPVEFFGIDFVDENTGWLSGSQGRIVKTTDGGDTWTLQTTGITADVNAIEFVDANTGWAVGTNGRIIRTTNGGTSWSTQNSGVNVQLYGLGALNANNVVVVGANSTRLRTTNGGSSWQRTDDFRRFRAAFDDNGQPRSDIIYILEDTGTGSLVDTWRISMLPRTATSSVGLTVDPVGGDELEIFTIKPFTEADEFNFTIDASNVPSADPSSVERPLDDVRVVPNPYLVTHLAETGAGRQLHFTNLPQRATIRIFTVSGRLVQTLNVDNPATEGRYIWDMRSNDNKEISYGVYIYHVDAPGVGEKVGKFAVIK
ncbi:MAG: hypothetical protein LAT84_14705 [Balneolia bacterium]|nr:hypothetical protein [Balneolia bacterium]